MKLDRKGIAGLAAMLIVGVSIAVSSVGVPILVDEIDTQPDSPLYALERAGEAIQETAIAGGQDWSIARAEERAKELDAMSDKGKAREYVSLAVEAEGQLTSAATASGDVRGLERAIEATKKHLKILKDVRERAPEPARGAISRAMERSASGLRILENLLEKREVPRSEEMGKRLENAKAKRLEQIKKLQGKLERVIERFESKKENVGMRIENVSRSFEEEKKRLEKKFENRKRKWERLAENEMAELEDRLERAEEQKERLLEHAERRKENQLNMWKERREKLLENFERIKEEKLERFEKLKGGVLDAIEEGKKPTVDNLLPENFLKILPPDRVRVSENVLENIEQRLEAHRDRIKNRFEERHERIKKRWKEKKRSLDDWWENRKKKLHEGFEEAKKRFGNRRKGLKIGIGENFQKMGENFERRLENLERKREEKIRKLEKHLERLKEKFRGEIKKIAEEIRKLQPKGFEWPPEDIWEEWLEERWPFNWSRKMKPGENVIPFVHLPWKPPWAGSPENLAFEIPENLLEEKPREEGYALMDVVLPDRPVSYAVNPTNDEGIPSESVVGEVREAFETWDAETTKELFSDDVTLTSASGFARDGVSAISFAPLGRITAAAEARVWYDESSGTITEFDVVFNSRRDYGVDPDGEGPETIAEFDLRAIATHEAGHALGLKDLTDSDLPEMTMYCRSEPGSTIKISLEDGDIAGIHELYGK